jgi:hypothetical protein
MIGHLLAFVDEATAKAPIPVVGREHSVDAASGIWRAASRTFFV